MFRPSRILVAINVLFGWGLSAAAADPERHPTPTALLYVSHLGNVGLHAAWAVSHRRYDPGLITGFATLVPGRAHRPASAAHQPERAAAVGTARNRGRSGTVRGPRSDPQYRVRRRNRNGIR